MRRRHTRQDKQNNPINDQNRPKDGDIKDAEPSADEADGDGARGRVPELELGEAPDEGAELVVLLGGQAGGCVAVLQAFILRHGWIPFGLQEEEEEV